MGSMRTKIARSRDVFLEDQLVDDGDKVKKANSSAEIPIIIDPVPPTMHANNGGKSQKQNHDSLHPKWIISYQYR